MCEEVKALADKYFTEKIVPGLAERYNEFYGVKEDMYGVERTEIDHLRNALALHIKERGIHGHLQFRRLVMLFWNCEKKEEKLLGVLLAKSFRKLINLEHISIFERLMRECTCWDQASIIARGLMGEIMK